MKQVNISATAREVGCTRRYVQLVNSGKAGACKTELQVKILKRLGKYQPTELNR